MEQERGLQRVRAEDDLSRLAAADHLVDEEVVAHREAAAADVGRMTERPEPLASRLGAQVIEQRQSLRPRTVELALLRVDPLLDESQHSIAQVPDVLRDPERPFVRHGSLASARPYDVIARARATSRGTSSAKRVPPLRAWTPSRIPMLFHTPNTS